jgi:hypothetical protein
VLSADTHAPKPPRVDLGREDREQPTPGPPLRYRCVLQTPIPDDKPRRIQRARELGIERGVVQRVFNHRREGV